MPRSTPVALVRELTSRGYNAEREAVTLLANAPDPGAALDRAIDRTPEDTLTLTAATVRETLDDSVETHRREDPDRSGTFDAGQTTSDDTACPEGRGSDDPPVSSGETTSSDGEPAGRNASKSGAQTADAGARPDEVGGSPPPDPGSESGPSSPPETVTSPRPSTGSTATTDPAVSSSETSTGRGEGSGRTPETPEVTGDVTDESTGTGRYEDFVAVFRDRYERLSSMLSGRVNRRPTSAVASLPGGSDAAIVGMISDIRSTANGHWLIELEDTAGTFPCLVTKDKDTASRVDDLLLDEVVAVEGRLADDGGILFVDSLHFPDVPRTYQPSTADRHVQAALVSDVHVGSQEFLDDAWGRFADWLHTEEAASVEYLLLAGDMVEGVGVYPGQDEELSIVDIYDQYEAFSEHLKAVPGDMEIVMIPGNHDAVRLAEPQPAFDDELREIMSAHDARITGNPSTVTVEGVSVLMYHGVSLDEVIAETPGAGYDEPHTAMYRLLQKRHVAPQFGERTRIAPEERDFLVIDEVPDVFHAGHVHKLGTGRYHNVTVINSGCWQAQTAFQRRVNIDPDAGLAPVVDLDTLDVTIRKFV